MAALLKVYRWVCRVDSRCDSCEQDDGNCEKAVEGSRGGRKGCFSMDRDVEDQVVVKQIEQKDSPCDFAFCAIEFYLFSYMN